VSLLSDSPNAASTVTRISTEAGVTRPTFYASFADIASAHGAAAQMLLDSAFAGIDLSTVDGLAEAEAMDVGFQLVLERLEERELFFLHVLSGPAANRVQSHIVDYVALRLRTASPVSESLLRGPLPAELSSGALAAGVVWMLVSWLSMTPRPETVHLIRQMRDFILRSVAGGLGENSQNGA
jgi:AcrR family transcriptional regulator